MFTIHPTLIDYLKPKLWIFETVDQKYRGPLSGEGRKSIFEVYHLNKRVAVCFDGRLSPVIIHLYQICVRMAQKAKELYEDGWCISLTTVFIR